MFSQSVDYPTAVASCDDEGVSEAINWVIEHTEDGDTVSVWTYLKSDLSNVPMLESFVEGFSNVVHIAGRGGGRPSGPGPVLMAWPDMPDIAQLMRYSRSVRALCVVSWHERKLRPWVAATTPVILGDASAWENATLGLDAVFIEALRGLTRTVNHNNTISAGFEKDQVVGALLVLHDAGIPLDADGAEGWALANGWSRKNPELLAKYVRDINNGRRPQSKSLPRPEYLATLRQRAAANTTAEE